MKPRISAAALILLAALGCGAGGSDQSAAQVKQDSKDFDLRQAAESGDAKRVQSLLDNGMNVNGKGYNDSTALLYAAVNGHMAVVKVLLARGADLDAQDSVGGTALMYAVWKGHTEVVRILLAAGADVDKKGRDGRTALSVAEKDDRAEIIKLLKEATAKPQGPSRSDHPVLAETIYQDAKGFFKIRPPAGWETRDYKEDPRGKVDFQFPPGTGTGKFQAQLKILGMTSPSPDFAALMNNAQREVGRIEQRTGASTKIEEVRLFDSPAVQILLEHPGGLKNEIKQVLIGGTMYQFTYGAAPEQFDHFRSVVVASIDSFEPLVVPGAGSDAVRHVIASKLRVARLYIQIGYRDWAAQAIQEGLKLAPEDKELLDLKAQIGSRQ